MFGSTLRKLRLLLYKNFLVRKRQWISALLVQILLPLYFTYNVKNIRNTLSPSTNQTVHNITYEEYSESEMVHNTYRYLYFAPDTTITQQFIAKVKKCVGVPDDLIKTFKTEKDLLEQYKKDRLLTILGVVFNNLDSSTVNLKYKIYTEDSIPSMSYFSKYQYYPLGLYHDGVLGLQLCLDKSFLEIKNKTLNIFMQPMPKPAVSDDEDSSLTGYVFATTAAIAFLFQLCTETSKASEEKFLGVNVLMAMNGVPNYLNLLSWLFSGLIFSLFYIIPMILLLNIDFGESVPLLYNGNLFIFWLILTIHLAHLITFGMHIAAYFGRSKFLNIVLLIIFISTTALKFYLQQSYYPYIPYLGLIFPNILLCRACEEVVYYQTISNEGIHWSNLFKVDDPAYGLPGSLGMIIIFSLLGAFIHFTLANYIYAINPGKYGAKKHPLYFLEYFKRSDNPNHYGKVEEFEFNNTDGKPFETVNDGAYTPGIQVRNLKKMYNVGIIGNAKVHALKGISIDFYQGQITSVLGHNGAGKTTMMSILTGMVSPSEGLVLINGKNTKDHMDEIMHDMGLCPQENIVFPNLSVYEQFKFFAMLKNKNKSSSIIEANVQSLLRKLKLHEKRNTLPKKLSGGQKRRVCLGMALVGDSSILILDEPTSGLDPEIRREIWDILLKTRGEKTILISTHDMEEADILGDRIAIVHSGKLRSYGSTLFLKKLLGQGNVEVTLSTEPWCNPESIRTYLGSQSEILNTDGSKVVLSIPSSPELPDALDRVESHKRNLGVTGMSVSLITLEQVFLKVAKNDDEVDSREPLITATHKLEGMKQSLQAARGLLYKKMTYALKNITTPLVIVALIILGLLTVYLVFSIDLAATPVSDPVDFKLNTYSKAKTFYKYNSPSKKYGNAYQNLTQQNGGEAIETSEMADLNEALLRYGNQNYDDYSTRVISAVEFKDIGNVLYAKFMPNIIKATYAFPIALNLLSNSLLQVLKGPEYNIEITGQQFPPRPNINSTTDLNQITLYIQMYGVPVALLVLLYIAISLIVIQPLREAVTNIKHLQKMTGLSCFNYWGMTFLFDFGFMFVVTIIIVIGFIIIDKILDLHLMKAQEIMILTGLLLLFVINVLPLMYSSTFVEFLRSTSAAIKLFTIVPLVMIIVELIMILLSTAGGLIGVLKIIRPIQKVLFMLTPYISLLHGQISFFETSLKNSGCRKMSTIYSGKDLCKIFNGLCCSMKCNKGTCTEPLKFFNGFDKEISLNNAVLYLCLTPIMYFAILWILESKLIPTLIARSTSNKFNSNEDTEEQVKKVKSNLANEIADIKNKSGQVVSNGRNMRNGENESHDRHVFFVYELRKRYGNLLAVKDINFGVNMSECFGLLGVNGAGKSTTFRMMTGEEIPDNGLIYLNEEELSGRSDRSQMGYCPQNDAIITSLNSYDHLRLFARLRGIPEPEVNNEVRTWIKRLNLTACASQPSGTYSGGNKRRLNIAISMIGIPDVVLLDEPTTGVDPAARRSLWNVIKSSQRSTGQAVVLTSHSMEECEALCGRLAIMVGGKFVCIGPSEELKQRFGAGYDIQVKLNPEKARTEMDAIKRDIEAALHCNLIDEHSGYLMYHVSSSATKWRKMYDVMSAVKQKYSSVEDFSVLSSTLEQLFLLFARSANTSQ